MKMKMMNPYRKNHSLQNGKKVACAARRAPVDALDANVFCFSLGGMVMPLAQRA